MLIFIFGLVGSFVVIILIGRLTASIQKDSYGSLFKIPKPKRENSLGNLPIIKFDDKDEWGDELKKEIEAAYKLWYYGKEQYEIYKKVLTYKDALNKFVEHNYNGKNYIPATDTSYSRTLNRAIDYTWKTPINMYGETVKWELGYCNDILRDIERKAESIHRIKNGNYKELQW